jgi:hypothetical protein
MTGVCVLTSSFDSPIMKDLHHLRPGIVKPELSSCDETFRKSGEPGTVSPSIEGSNRAPGGIFCHRSSAGMLSSASIRSSGDLSLRPKASTTVWYADSATNSGRGLKSSTAPPVLRHLFISGSFEQRNIVTATAVVSHSPTFMLDVRTSTCTLPACCDLIWVATETADELSDPVHRRALIMETIVCFVSCFAKFSRCHETCNTKPVAGRFSQYWDASLASYNHSLDGDADHGLALFNRHLDN